MGKDELIYLAIPYTWNPEESFRIVNEVASELLAHGYNVISPISQDHPISKLLPDEMYVGPDFWINKDLPILRKCDRIFFVVIGKDGLDLIENSQGCQAEMEEAIKNDIDIDYYPYTFEF